jgi:hypothetical protein
MLQRNDVVVGDPGRPRDVSATVWPPVHQLGAPAQRMQLALQLGDCLLQLTYVGLRGGHDLGRGRCGGVAQRPELELSRAPLTH